MGLCIFPARAGTPRRWPCRGQPRAGWPATAAPARGSSGRKLESCRIRLKVCRRYLMDPCTTPVKFGADRPKNKKVMGPCTFPARAGSLSLATPRPAHGSPPWLAGYTPPSLGSSGRKFESCRIRLKLCRRYLMDPRTTPAKFGADRQNIKKVFGTMYFPGQGGQAGRGRWPAGKAPLCRGKLSPSAPSRGCPASENFKFVRSRPNSVGV